MHDDIYKSTEVVKNKQSVRSVNFSAKIPPPRTPWPRKRPRLFSSFDVHQNKEKEAGNGPFLKNKNKKISVGKAQPETTHFVKASSSSQKRRCNSVVTCHKW